ncbi:MAG: hypothetical protein C0601_07490 [Candidatus Muiribacterium halophilum]|uniref:Uncharacterized protein n=1 Tax=Muiribacterium halophilum TaxID=2053465 RepID=A0A2N5ZFR2_MUIH1|nr:MAG: hypothetical protein C0601_07490 [Candidatus Muirbacterium halophilum]
MKDLETKMDKFLFVYSAYENLGIEYLSASLKKKGYVTDLLFFPMLFEDSMLNIDLLSNIFRKRDKIIDRADLEGVKAVFFNVPTDYYQYYLEIAGRIKAKKDIPIIFGGIHPTSIPEKVLKNEVVDMVAVGEGEITIAKLADYLTGKRDTVPEGIWYKKDGKIVRNGVCEPLLDLNELPLPDKRLFYNKAKYLSETYTIFTSRGCPYNCSYCINNIWYSKDVHSDMKRVRRRSVEDVIRELEWAKKEFDISSVMFEDDVFYLSDSWHWEFVRKYKKRIDLPFVCVMHPKSCQNYEIIESLRDIGCIQMEIGIQTLNQKVRREMLNRFETNQEINKALKNLHKSNIPFNIDHIAGLPGDTFEYQEKAARVYSKYRPNRVLYFFITNYPATEIEKRSKELGETDDISIEKMHMGLGETDETTGSVSKEKIKRLEQLRVLFGWLPYLSESVVRGLIKTKTYRFLPDTRILTKILPSILATIFGKEPRGKVILKKYMIEMFNFL